MVVYSIIQKSQLEGANRLDAEYYQPEYLESGKRILQTKSYEHLGDIDGQFITGPFGSEFKVENYVLDSDFRYIRGRDVKDFFLLGNENVYIPREDFERLKKYSLHENDILIAVVGTLGNAVIIDSSVGPAIFSCKSTAFRTNAVNPYYLIAYLNSRYGRNLLGRSVRGAVQTGLNIDDLKSLLIFIPSKKKQDYIASFIIKAKQLCDGSKSLYSRAEGLLLEKVGLKDFKPEDELSYIINSSKVESANRTDAEYFQPKYKKLISRIKNKNARLLGELVSMKKGIEPGSGEYQEEGKLFIRVSSLSKYGIEEKDQKYLSEELYQKLKDNFEPKVGELLLTKDATPGIAYLLKERIYGITAGGILRLELKSKIEPEYLALVLNSIVGQMQMERDTGGSVILHWRPSQIRNCLIPILPKPTQQRIAKLAHQSYQARKESKELLEKAKREVEKMIEKGGEKT